MSEIIRLAVAEHQESIVEADYLVEELEKENLKLRELLKI